MAASKIFMSTNSVRELSLSEVRILLEIEATPDCTSKLLTDKLSIDSGYMSRILNQFQNQMIAS